MKRFDRIKRGAKAWGVGLRKVRAQKSLRALMLFPLLLNGALLMSLLYLMISQVAPLIILGLTSSSGPGGEPSSFWVAVITAAVYFTVVVLWAILVMPVYAISNILLAPFYSLAAEKVLKQKGLNLPTPTGAGAWLKFFARSFAVGLAKSVVLLLVAVPLFLGGFLPILGLIFVYLSFVVLGFDCTDYSLEVLDKGFKERFSYLRRHLWEYLGFGLIFFVVGFIPLVMIVLLPLGIVAGACLVADLENPAEELNKMGRCRERNHS